jgi:hypothetical protein
MEVEAKVRFMGEIVTPRYPCSTWNEKMHVVVCYFCLSFCQRCISLRSRNAVRTIHPKGYGVRPIKNAVIVTASRTQTVINNGSILLTL